MITDWLNGIIGLIEGLAVAIATGFAIYIYNAWRTRWQAISGKRGGGRAEPDQIKKRRGRPL